MKVQVKAAGHLFQRMPDQKAEMEVEVAAGGTVVDVLGRLGLSRKQVWVIRVNGENVTADHPLGEADFVELFPLVGGG